MVLWEGVKERGGEGESEREGDWVIECSGVCRKCDWMIVPPSGGSLFAAPLRVVNLPAVGRFVFSHGMLRGPVVRLFVPANAGIARG